MTKWPEMSSVWFRRSPQILNRISSSKTCRLGWFQSWHGFSSIWGALFFNQSAWPSYLKFLKVSSELFFVSRASRWPTRRWGTFWGGSNLNHKFILVKKLENNLCTWLGHSIFDLTYLHVSSRRIGNVFTRIVYWRTWRWWAWTWWAWLAWTENKFWKEDF